MKNIAQALASRLIAIKNCREASNIEWLDKHSEALDKLEKLLPSGSGFDSGTTLDREASGTAKLVFNTSFHHMDENGCYDGWTEHTVTVTADFVVGLDFTDITGEDPDGTTIDYLAETFELALSADAPASEQPTQVIGSYPTIPARSLLP